MNDAGRSAPLERADGERGPSLRCIIGGCAIDISLHGDFDSVESDWREFEQQADCTVFQTFDWLATWHRYIGAQNGVRPVFVVGRDDDRKILFLMPLALERGSVSRLTWLGSELCDYNAPLLATEFSRYVGHGEFQVLWRDICSLIKKYAELRHDIIDLEKMPERINSQQNPFLHLRTSLHPSGAYLANLSGDWEQFYAAKRSSSRRKGDRNRTRRLAAHGDIHLITPQDASETAVTVKKLFEQKSWSLARMGADNLFARPGFREFFLDLATNPRTNHLVHVSRLQVGSIWAATNLALTFRGGYYHVLCSYERRAVSPFGPGSVHLRELLRYALDRGFNRFDFTIGDEPYKLEWSDTKLALYDHVSSATLRGWPVAAGLRAGRRLKRAIKQNPALWRVFSRVRPVIASWRRQRRETMPPNNDL